MVKNAEATDSQDRLLEPGAVALVAIQCVLIAGSLSFEVFPLLVDGFVRLAHFDVQSAGLCITAEMLGQSVGAAADPFPYYQSACRTYRLPQHLRCN